MTDQYAELHAGIARLRGDLDFERDVADKPRAFGPPPGGRFRLLHGATCRRPAGGRQAPRGRRSALHSGSAPMPATNDGAALEVFRAATVPASPAAARPRLRDRTPHPADSRAPF